MRVRLDIDDAFLREMQCKLGDQASLVDLVREGLTLLRWAVDETVAGRIVVSTSAAGTELKRPLTPTIAAIEQRHAQARSATGEERTAQPALNLSEK
jgi:hypothetical protein